MSELEQREIAAIAKQLSRWFQTNARDLPWRRTRDPYAIWVSEIMLQQTRVETVERYWERFLARFPDVASLAAADEDAVLQQWSGLGYYRRARLLHRGARHVQDQHDGTVPGSATELRAVPGIGRYTAGAIASIAFDRPAPLVDGNVARVHSRLAAIAEPAEQDAKAEHHWRFVEGVLAHGRPRVLAQALMELGATVCTPRSPSCLVCPVRSACRARASRRQDEIPAVRVKKISPRQQLFALALGYGRRLLLERRPEQGLLAGLWCLPLFERQLGEPEGQREALAEAASEQLGVALTLAAQPCAPVKHVFTHRIWHVIPWPARARRAVKIERREDGRTFAWIDASTSAEHGAKSLAYDLGGGVPTLTRKLLRVLE